MVNGETLAGGMVGLMEKKKYGAWGGKLLHQFSQKKKGEEQHNSIVFLGRVLLKD